MSDVTLQAYMERRVDDLDKRIDQRIKDLEQRLGQHFDLNDTAINKAERAIHERLVGMNEFRDALKDQANRMATRIELSALDTQVQDLRRDKANLDGRLLVIAVGASVVINWLLIHFGSVAKP